MSNQGLWLCFIAFPKATCLFPNTYSTDCVMHCCNRLTIVCMSDASSTSGLAQTSMFVLVLALKSPARNTSPKLMASPTFWHMCSNSLLSAYGEPYGAAYTMHRNKGLWKTLPKRSQILVPSFIVFQTVILFAHVSLTSTAMPPLCFRTTPCVVTGLATSKQQNPSKTGNVSPEK